MTDWTQFSATPPDSGWTPVAGKSAPDVAGWTPAGPGKWSEFSLTPPAAPKSNDGQFVSGLKRSFQEVPGIIAGAAGGLADVLGASDTAAKLIDYAQSEQERVGRLHTADASSITDAWDGKTPWMDFLANSAGYVTGQAALALMTGGLGALAGKQIATQAVKQAGEVAAAKAIASGAAKDAAVEAAAGAMRVAAEKAATRGAVVGVGAQNVGMELGSIYPDAVEQAQSEGRTLDTGDKAKALGSALAAAGVDTLADVLMAGRILRGSKVGAGAEKAPKLLGSEIAARAAREIPVGIVREGGTEGIQTAIEQYGAGKPIDPREIIDAIGVGAVGGGLGGGLASLHKAKEPSGAAPAAPATPAAGLEGIAAAKSVDEAIAAFTQSVAPPAAQQKDEFASALDSAKQTLRSDGVIDALRERFGAAGVTGLLTSLNQAANPNVLPETRARHLQVVEEMLFWLNARRNEEPAAQPALEGPPTLPALEMRRSPGIGFGSTPTGGMRVDSTGRVVPETRADVTATRAAVDERASLGRQAPAAARMDARRSGAEWFRFRPETGSLGVARADMPQIKAEHRGALTNFLEARGVDHDTEEVAPGSLRPTQAEFSPEKVQKAVDYEGGDRAVLVSRDGYILDGHHQWLARVRDGRPLKVIRFNASIDRLIDLAHEFPSSTTQRGARQIPVGEASDLLPTGEATYPDERIPIGEASDLIPTGDAQELPRSRIPVGTATEITPELIELGDAEASPAGATAQTGGRNGDQIEGQGRQGPRRQEGLLNPPVAPAPASPQPAASPSEAAAPGPGAPEEAPRVFRNRRNAERERDARGNEWKLRRVRGGFILRRKTDAELAAEARAGRRLAAGASRDRSLLSTIASGGGLNISERADTIGEGNRNIGGKMLFTRTGRTVHQWAEKLLEAGFIPPGTDEVRWLQNAIQEEYAGRRKHYAMDDEESLDADLEARRLAAQGDEPDPLDPFDVADLQAEGYTEASPEVQAATEELIAAAEEAGIDIEALREDAARATEGQDDDAYQAELQARAKSAIEAARRGAAPSDAGAGGPGGEDRGGAADARGDAGAQAEAERLDDRLANLRAEGRKWFDDDAAEIGGRDYAAEWRDLKSKLDDGAISEAEYADQAERLLAQFLEARSALFAPMRGALEAERAARRAEAQRPDTRSEEERRFDASPIRALDALDDDALARVAVNLGLRARGKSRSALIDAITDQAISDVRKAYLAEIEQSRALTRPQQEAPALPAEAGNAEAPETPTSQRPPKSFMRKVVVTTPVYVEASGTFETRAVDADAALTALDEDINEMRAFVRCLEGA